MLNRIVEHYSIESLNLVGQFPDVVNFCPCANGFPAFGCGPKFTFIERAQCRLVEKRMPAAGSDF